MRSFIALLLLIVVFLTGMLVGMDKNEGMHANHLSSEEHITKQQENLIEWEVYEEQPIIEEQKLTFDPSKHTTQKIATLLETGVKGFYEVVVDILYQITSLFV